MSMKIYMGFRKGGSPIAGIIRFFLRIHLIKLYILGKTKKHPFKTDVWNHNFILFHDIEKNKKYILETTPTVKFIEYEKTDYYTDKYEYKLKKLKAYRPVDIDILLQFVEDVEHRKYEYANFFYHIIYILFGIWLGKKKDNYIWYCAELSAACYNYLYSDIFKEWYKYNPLMIDLDPNFIDTDE